MDKTGNIIFIGRIDNQIKLHGHRIELEEINNIVNNFNSIKKSICIIKDKKIICFFVANTKININILKNFLKDKLPTYMIPFKFIQLDSIPITINGKIDNKKLQNINIENNNKEILLPKNDIEKTLLNTFHKLLIIDNISIDDNFFDLGRRFFTCNKIIS